MTILVVEDDEDIRAMIAVILDSDGYDVAVARDGQEALRYLHANHSRVDLVLSDIMMPFVDGWLLLHAIRQDSALSSIPVVLMSGAMTPARLPEGVALIKKPFRMEELSEMVRSRSRPLEAKDPPSRTSEPGIRCSQPPPPSRASSPGS